MTDKTTGIREEVLPCEVVQDLLPAYIEGLTHVRTGILIAEHLNHCRACEQLANDMRSEVTMQRPPEGSLRFLKRRALLCRLAAVVTAVLTVVLLCLLYRDEYRYPNTEIGRMEALREYVRDSDGMREVAHETVGHRLILFYYDDGADIYGYMELERGITDRYRAVRCDRFGAEYRHGIYRLGVTIETGGEEKRYLCLMCDSDGLVSEAELIFEAPTERKAVEYSRPVRFAVHPSYVYWWDLDIQGKVLGFDYESLSAVGLNTVRLFNADREEVTEQVRIEEPNGCNESTDSEEPMGMVSLMTVVLVMGAGLAAAFLTEGRGRKKG